jgi:predicted metal-dependent hydrolase
VAELAPQIGVRYDRIAIKGQSTRWGSCSSKRNLNFNWRLMMAPPGAVDYVIIHELCHLKELNHSPRFWALVAQHCPDYRRWERWLKVNIARLRG